MRAFLGLILYVVAGFCGFLAFGAAMSEPGQNLSKATLISWAWIYLAGSAAAAWTAGVLWIGGSADAVWKVGGNRKAPAAVFLVLAVIFAIPWVLLQTLGETATLSNLQVVTWVLTPPSLIMAAWRLLWRNSTTAQQVAGG